MNKAEAKEQIKPLWAKGLSLESVFMVIDSIDEKPFTFKEQLLLNIAKGVGVALADHSALYVAEKMILVANTITEELKNESNT